ncbi:uncharacterized protein JCM6883_006672 [Sporobolomyces salmoneus]|uniref:uncharacterized protein n=1 Tax=Sporobolomyces salmoneus TaxID=183962 RepID=UPI003175D84E
MSTHSSANSTYTSRSTTNSFAQSLASLRQPSTNGGSKHRLKPASSITRQENRLGITTDYVDLSLHSAAAKGNVGLVQYALSHGQPVNSVLNGVLPLHAASSSGNETVVKMLIEAGADVNSPRLPRRYTNERSKTSGLAAGTQGSTPLHFAAANGHVSIIKLLLSYGANPRAAEKHGLTPETIALEQGFVEAADVLRSWQPVQSDRTERGGGSDDAASIRSKTSLHSLSKKRLQAQRSFDAIATKISQHAAHPHLPGLHSSASMASLASLGSSSVSPNASSSQISLGAAMGPSASSSMSPIPTPNRRSSLSHPSLGLAKESASNPRRPSLPSVWEKAAHPRATIRQALGMSKIGQKESDRRAMIEAMASSRSSLGSAIGEECALAEEDEDELEEEGDGREDEKGEKEERRRSMELHRPLRMDSFTKIDSVPSSAPPTQSSFNTTDLNSLTSTTSTLRPDRSPTLSRAPSASKHEMYRPRMSSQLSMGSEADGSEEKKGEKEKEAGSTLETTPSRQRSVSNPQPESRSPLLQQLHQNLLEDAAATASPFLYSASSTTPSPASSRRPSTGATAGLADHELSSDGSNTSSRIARPTPADVRKAFSVQHQNEGRNRADSLASNTSSFSAAPSSIVTAPPPPPAPVSAVQARAEANRNRSDSTASSLSTNSFLGGQSNFSYAGTASTAPTSVAPSSPGTRAEQFNIPIKTRLPSNLAPLYETKLTHASESSTSAPSTLGVGGGGANTSDKDTSVGITRAQARSRVQKAERELLSYQPGSASRAASDASSGAQSSASRMSLRDQLAQYGKSLALEREVLAKEQREEREKEVNSGYRIETISSSNKALNPSSPTSKSSAASTHSSSSALPVPTWRAVPTVDRLMPPPAHNGHARQSPSPSSTRRHHHQPHRGETPTIFENSPPSTKSSPVTVTKQEPETSSSPLAARRPSTPTSLAGSTASGGNGGAGGTVLGIGIGGVHFVEVPKDASPHHRHTHHSSHSHSHNTRNSERSHSDKGTSVTSVRDQVEEERREQERRDASIPKAVLTAAGGGGGGKKKGIKGWFK